jgi:sialate O-acetylesterase
MKQGVVISSGLQNWQILQQKNGKADLKVAGWHFVEGLPAGTAIKITARVMHEYTGEIVKPWAVCDVYGVNWSVVIPDVPTGGLYRLETMIDYPGSNGLLVTRGDMVHHFGVGDIFVIAGQSNAAGRARDPIHDPPELGVHLMRNSGRWDLASHPFNDTTNAVYDGHFETANPSHCPYLAFAKKMRAELNYPVGLIQSALGGSGLWQWNKREEGTLYTNMLRMIKDNTDSIRGILWYQGCADAFEKHGEDYFERFRQFVQDVRDDLNAPNLPFYTVQLNRCTLESEPEKDRHWGMVREAQRRAAHEIEDVHVIPANDLAIMDFIHNSASANLAVGERTARAVLATLYGKPYAWQAPEIDKAELIAPDTVAAHLGGIVNWINPFEVPPDQLCFTAEDRDGLVSVKSYRVEGHTFLLTFERALTGKAVLHGAWQMNPPFTIPCDCARLPMLSFYGLPIQ